MEFIELTEEQFREFAYKHSLKNFIQTPEMAHIRHNFGFEYYYVGVMNNSKIVAATMMGSRKSHFGKLEFYAPRGLLVDYEDYEVLSYFTKSLKQYVKDRNGYVLRIDPYYITKEKDINGNEIDGGIDHTEGIKNLEKVGFNKCSNNYQQIKYMFSLDLKDKEELYKNFHSLPKRMIKKANENNIIIREASFEELKHVQELIEETGTRKKFSSKTLEYYELLYKEFYPRNEIKFMLGELDLLEYQNTKKENIAKLTHELTTIQKENKKEECQKKIEKEQQLLEESLKIPMNEDGKIILSAGVFILYGNELVYLFGGNKKEYMHYGSSYLMQWTMMQYGIEKRFNKYNFYGFSSPTKEDGVYNFKRGFSGYVEELIGDYELITSKYYYVNKLFHFLRH